MALLPRCRGRTRLVLVGLLAVCQVLLLGLFHVTPVKAQPAPAIVLSPLSGPPGTTLTVTGSNFAVSTALSVTYDGATMGTINTGTGSWSLAFAVPSSPSGGHTVQAGSATATFVVSPIFTLTPSTGAPGITVVVAGSGYAASQTAIVVVFNGSQVATTPSDTLGSFSVSFVVPAVTAGSYTVSVGNAPTRTFTVAAWLALNPNTGPVGTTVNVTGGALDASVSVNINFDGTSVRTVTTDAQGALSTSFQVPPSPGGARPVSVTGSSAGAQATFTVTAALAFDQPTAAPGVSVTLKGTGFAANETGIVVTFDSTVVAPGVAADARGSWSTTFTVPPVPAGSHIIRAFGPQTPANTVPPATLVLTAGFRFSRSSGPPGTSINVLGYGFPANANGITLTVGDGLQTVSTSASEQGLWTASFTVPLAPSGPLVIRVTGFGLQPVEQAFTVTPAFTLSTSSGSPGTPITVQGNGFAASQTGITITLGTAVATASSNAQGSWTASITVPPSPSGSYPVRSGGGAPVLELSFTVVPALSISPDRGAPGSSATISGQGFAASQTGITVTLGAVSATASSNAQGSWSANITIPLSPSGTYPVRSGGAAPVLELVFTVVPAMSISADRGAPGASVTVNGVGFASNQRGIAVTIGQATVASGVSANAQGSWSANITIPLSPSGTYPVRSGGAAPVLEVSFTVVPALSISTDRGAPGSNVTVNGVGFGSNERGISVALGQLSVASGIIAGADGSWTVTFPAPTLPAGSYLIAAAGSSTETRVVRGDSFIISTGIGVSPARAVPGTAVTVSAAGFGAREANITVTYDGTTVASGLTADANGTFRASFTVPASPSGGHTVKAFGATSAAGTGPEARFEVTTTIAVSRTGGSPGAPVTVTGSGYGANEGGIVVSFDGKPVLQGVKADANGSFTVSFTPPPAPTGQHMVQASGAATVGAARTEEGVAVAPSLTLSPSTGNVGMNVDVMGAGFGALSAITVLYDSGQARATAQTDAAGSFKLTLVIPRSQHGDHPIRAQDGQGGQAQGTFAMESTPPAAIKPLSPRNGGAGGLLGGYRPTLTWAASDDPSGAVYSLQIDTAPDFSKPRLVVRELANPTYTLTEDEQLPRGKYYWRVRATDGAANDGPWSDTYVIQSGVLPVWLLPLLGVVAVLALGGGAYTLLRLRSRPSWQPARIPGGVRVEPGDSSAAGALPPAPRRSLPAPPRLALPSPTRRGRRLSPEEEANLQHVLNFVRSIPLVQVSADLSWLDELIAATEPSSPTVREDVISGRLQVRYQPAWVQHPTYADLERLLRGQPFLQRLQEYISTVDQCASDAVELLRELREDCTVALPPQTPKDHLWLLSFTVVQDSLGWFRGMFLREPTAKDYTLQPSGDSAFTLSALEDTPFPRLRIDDLTEGQCATYRDLHVQLRVKCRGNIRARQLASKMTQTDVLREQLLGAIAQLS